MKNNVNTCCRREGRRNIVILSAIILTGLFALDVIYKGEVYRRLPVSIQKRLSEWIGR